MEKAQLQYICVRLKYDYSVVLFLFEFATQNRTGKKKNRRDMNSRTHNKQNDEKKSRTLLVHLRNHYDSSKKK
jgi:dipeptidyl aminopeptidase/acylaminoacyl peptidase